MVLVTNKGIPVYCCSMSKPKRPWIDYARYSGFGIFLILGLALDIAGNNNAFLSSLEGNIFTRSFYCLACLILIFLRHPQLHWGLIVYLLIFTFGISYFPFLVSSKIFIISSFFFALFGGAITLFFRIIFKFTDAELFLFVDCPALLALLPGLSFNSKVGYLTDFPFWIPALIIAIAIMGISGFIYWLKQRRAPKKAKNPFWARVTGWALAGFILGFAYAWCGISSLNVAFDYSEPQYQAVTITDLKYINRVRAKGYYTLSFKTAEGYCSIAVPKSIYVELEIGDSVEVAYCPGLFGEEYYIYPTYL